MKLRPGMAIEMTCWTLSAGLFVVYFVARADGEFGRQDAIAAFRDAAQVASRSEPAAAGLPRLEPGAGAVRAEPAALRARTAMPAERAGGPEARVRAHATPPAENTPNESLPVALLRIARVDLEVPVFPDLGERSLNRGAGLIDGTGLPGGEGNVAIAAHRDGYFRALKDVAEGDVLELETLRGTRMYRVSAISIVEPTELWPLADTGEPAVTLVTCYPFYFVGSAPQRYIVRAVAVK